MLPIIDWHTCRRNTYWLLVLPFAHAIADVLSNGLCLGTGELEHLSSLYHTHSKVALVFTEHLWEGREELIKELMLRLD